MNLLVFGCGVIGSWLFFWVPRAGASQQNPARGRAGYPDGVVDVPLLLDLLAALLASGVSLERGLLQLAQISAKEIRGGLAAVGGALALGASWAAAWRVTLRPASEDPLSQLERSTRFIALTGAPSATLLRAEAARLRQAEHRDLQLRAASLGVKLVLPMGLCALPAFMFLGVVPVLISLMPGD